MKCVHVLPKCKLVYEQVYKSCGKYVAIKRGQSLFRSLSSWHKTHKVISVITFTDSLQTGVEVT